MHYKKHVHTTLQKHFPENGAALKEAIGQEFDLIRPEVLFARTSPNPIDRRMEVAAYLLATMRVLERQGFDFAAIRSITLDIAREMVRPKNSLQAWAKRLPVLIIGSYLGQWLLKKFALKIGKLGHPDGFRAAILTQKEDTLGFGYGVDILECGICKLYQKHGDLHFAPILCEVDYITTGIAGLKMHRSGTIATGATHCDFRYEKVEI